MSRRTRAADRVPVVGAELGLGVELVPERGGSGSARSRRHRSPRPCRRAVAARGEVGQPEGDVLDEDLEVVGALPVGQARVDLARLGVDEIGLDPVAVTPEQRVRERAVAPVDAAPMEVDEERRHRVEQPVAVDGPARAAAASGGGGTGASGRGRRSAGSPSDRSGASARPTGGRRPAARALSSWRRTSYSVRRELERQLLERVESVAVDDRTGRDGAMVRPVAPGTSTRSRGQSASGNSHGSVEEGRRRRGAAAAEGRNRCAPGRRSVRAASAGRRSTDRVVAHRLVEVARLRPMMARRDLDECRPEPRGRCRRPRP